MAKIRFTNSSRILLILVIIGAACGFKFGYWDHRPQTAKAAATIGRVALPDVPEASLSTNAKLLPVPSGSPSVNGGSQIDWKVMAWNSQFGLMYANGGPQTAKGSLIDQAKLQINIIRQDDCYKSCADLVKFTSEYKNNPNSPAVFISFMGDGCPFFFYSLCKAIDSMKLGPEYAPVGFYTMGKSYGEDKVMGPSEWKTNPQSSLGKAVSCVLRDGDMNILLKWAGDNGIKVNPDETSYDPQAINLISANDFLDAANKYITGYTEKRKLIVAGKKTSKDTTIGVDGVATWTPGDANVARKKGGLVNIASTKEYATQMPNLTITCRKWTNDHRTDVENLIIALATAGDQVRSFKEAQMFAAKVSAAVYNEQDANFWLTLYKGTTERDAAGLQVSLGGSMAFNLADAAGMMGQGKDGLDRYRAVYKTFGDILVKMYPEIMPTYPEYSKVIDKSFLMAVVANHPELMEGKALKVEYADKMTQTVSSKSYQIQFQTGSSTILSGSAKVLDDIFNSAVVAEGLKVGVYGHTDNVGNPSSNEVLSQERANAVKEYLMNKGISSARIESNGYGDTQPIGDNNTAEGRAKNRRVQITLGN